MKKFLWLLFLPCAFSCTSKRTLKEQLTTAFTYRLGNIDSSCHFDSLRILWRTGVNEKLGRIIDDTVYIWEYNRIVAQLASSVQKQDRDSIAFYRYEIRVLKRGIDSITTSIGMADTTRNYGSLMACQYFLNKNGKSASDSTLLYLDSTNVLRYTGYLDASISKTIQKLQ